MRTASVKAGASTLESSEIPGGEGMSEHEDGGVGTGTSPACTPHGFPVSAIAQCPGIGGTLSLMLSHTKEGLGSSHRQTPPERNTGQESIQQEKGRAGEHPRENSSERPTASVSAEWCMVSPAGSVSLGGTGGLGGSVCHSGAWGTADSATPDATVRGGSWCAPMVYGDNGLSESQWSTVALQSPSGTAGRGAEQDWGSSASPSGAWSQS